jgi:hypothetical protein
MDLREHMEAKVRNPNCEACGAENWVIPDGTFDLVSTPGDHGVTAAAPIPVLVAVCGDCGSIRMFSVDVVAQA